ncbi:3195_t:CDS:10 [Funneliformis mosseae]|uniref:3195_t:CDS:1 n=1 Tax=Funneliformis mosseae TaxID=27381 RepID=A0A9N8VUD5_FUNMO|nr:3195_t:CDS:10 [Funneliformis mosseae]
MLSDIKDYGPGFDYFLDTPCNDWDALQYHEFWKNNNFGLDKATVIRSFNKQIQQIKEYGTEVEIKNAIRLENQLKLPMELRLRMVMDYVSAKGGRIDNFWTKSLPRLKHRNVAEVINNTKNRFYSCDGVQVGSGNTNQSNKRSYGNCEQSNIEEIPTKGSKKQKPDFLNLLYIQNKSFGLYIHPSERYVEDEPSGSDEEVSPALPNCWNNSLDGHNESNGHDMLDIVIGIHEDDDENPFIIKNGKGSRNNKFKTTLSWKHAINNIDINDASMNDWVAENHNVSLDFRNFQLDVINQLKDNQTFSYFKDMEQIFESKPEYVSCSEKVWKKIRPRPLTPIMLPQNVIMIISEYNTLLNDKQLMNTRWCENWSLRDTLQTDEDRDIFECVQIVSRNFFMYLSSVSFNESNELNEDTFVHRYCHQILEEIFGKTDFALVWANGESESSKERRALDGNNHGRKPDFRVLGKIDDANREFLFGEIKPPAHTDIISKGVIKLAEFMKGSLDLIINRCGYIVGIEIYGILICGYVIKIFNMDLAYDGLYRCSLLSKILLPTENSNFLNIVTVVSTLYSLLKRLRSTINVVNSSQLQSSSSSHSYCRNRIRHQEKYAYRWSELSSELVHVVQKDQSNQIEQKPNEKTDRPEMNRPNKNLHTALTSE